MTYLRPIIFMILGLAACSGGSRSSAPGGDPNRAVTVSEWCNSLTTRICERFGECLGQSGVVASCVESGVSSCLAGRDAAVPSGHSGRELRTCWELVDQTRCEGYIATISTHGECQATPPTGTTP
jgi:hypothetical protein